MPGTNSNKSAYYDDTPGASLGSTQNQKTGHEQTKKTASKEGAGKQGNANQG